METPQKPEYYWTEELVKLVSMMPADGWDAAFLNGDGTIFRAPLTMWVMRRVQEVKRTLPDMKEVSRNEDTHEVIHGYYSGDKCLEDAQEDSNFIGYFRHDETEETIRSVSDAQRPGAVAVNSEPEGVPS